MKHSSKHYMCLFKKRGSDAQKSIEMSQNGLKIKEESWMVIYLYLSHVMKCQRHNINDSSFKQC